MLKFRKLVICSLLVGMNLSLAFRENSAVAGLFDFWSPKRKPAAANSADSQRVGQLQGSTRAAAYADNGVPASSVADSQAPSIAAYSPQSVPAESAPLSPLTSTGVVFNDYSTHCLNCGQDDHCQSCLRHCRKNCKQTWYPRTAPYCQPGWGWNQPCWRRTVDTYNCPRPQQISSPPRRENGPEAPAPELPANPRASEDLLETSPDEFRPEPAVVPRESGGRR